MLRTTGSLLDWSLHTCPAHYTPVPSPLDTFHNLTHLHWCSKCVDAYITHTGICFYISSTYLCLIATPHTCSIPYTPLQTRTHICSITLHTCTHYTPPQARVSPLSRTTHLFCHKQEAAVVQWNDVRFGFESWSEGRLGIHSG